MVSKIVTLRNKSGFHIRPASVFSTEMQKFPCEVFLMYNSAKINAKSIMSIISSCIKCGESVEIQCIGSKEEAALECAVALVESGLGEKQEN